MKIEGELETEGVSSFVLQLEDLALYQMSVSVLSNTKTLREVYDAAIWKLQFRIWFNAKIF